MPGSCPDNRFRSEHSEVRPWKAIMLDPRAGGRLIANRRPGQATVEARLAGLDTTQRASTARRYVG
jgi:hypothetical protein